MVELYDFNNNNNSVCRVVGFDDFFQLNENELSPPCKCEVFEFKEQSSSAYILVLIPNYKIISLISHAPFIKIFGFSSFNSNPYEINRITFEYFVNKKILDVFLMDDNEQNTLVVLTNEFSNRRRVSKIMTPGDMLTLRKTSCYIFSLRFYDLNNLDNDNNENFLDIEIDYEYLSYYYNGEDLFIKSLYISNYLTAFVYYKKGTDIIYVELFELNYAENANLFSPKSIKDFSLINNNRYFDTEKSLNDFIKINYTKLAFICAGCTYTSIEESPYKIEQTTESKEVCILIINLKENDGAIDINIIDYFINYDTYGTTKQLSAFSFNGYLLLGTTL